MTGNFLSFYSVKNEETLWAELDESSLKDGKYGLGVVLIPEKESCRFCGKVLVAKFTKAVNVVVFVPGYEKFCLGFRLLLKFAPFCERNSFQCIELYVDEIKNEAYTD